MEIVTNKRRQTSSRAANSTDSPDARGESVLARWSRRKSVARLQERERFVEPDHRAGTKSASPQASEAAAANLPEKTDADLPPVESLDQNSDFSQFLSPKVSDKLRQAALKKLFHLPGMNIVDGLDDYAEDYTYFVPLGNIITSDMRHHMEREAEELKKRAMESASDSDDEQQTGVEEQGESSGETTAAAESEAPPGDAAVEDPIQERPGDEHKDETDSRTS